MRTKILAKFHNFSIATTRIAFGTANHALLSLSLFLQNDQFSQALKVLSAEKNGLEYAPFFEQ